MDFPIAEYMDEDACYAKLVAVLHPSGLVCPRCEIGDRLKVHRRHRAPVIDYRCDACGRVFNAFTGTEFHKTHRRPSEILLILRGISLTPRHYFTMGPGTTCSARAGHGTCSPSTTASRSGTVSGCVSRSCPASAAVPP